MSFKNLELEREGHIAIVTLNRPDHANALSQEHLREIEEVSFSFREDADTRVVIFTGAGTHFSGGADLFEPPPPEPVPMVVRRRRARIGERAVRALFGIDQITIGAWNGGALGGGACLMTAMDFRVGAEDCFMQYPEIDLGINLMWQSLPLVVQIVGPSRAKRLVIGGERIHARELLEWGMLERVVPKEELLGAAREMAERYVNKSPVAAQMIKRSVNMFTGALDQAIMHMDVDQNLLTQFTEDRRAAVAAYRTDNKPEFKGN